MKKKINFKYDEMKHIQNFNLHLFKKKIDIHLHVKWKSFQIFMGFLLKHRSECKRNKLMDCERKRWKKLKIFLFLLSLPDFFPSPLSYFYLFTSEKGFPFCNREIKMKVELKVKIVQNVISHLEFFNYFIFKGFLSYTCEMMIMLEFKSLAILFSLWIFSKYLLILFIVGKIINWKLKSIKNKRFNFSISYFWVKFIYYCKGN